MSLTTTPSLGPGQTGLCCLSLRRRPSSLLALALRPLLTSVIATEQGKKNARQGSVLGLL